MPAELAIDVAALALYDVVVMAGGCQSHVLSFTACNEQLLK